MPPSISSVVAALRDLGLRNAGTPLLIASTPVSAAAGRERPGDQEHQATPSTSPCSERTRTDADSAFSGCPST